MKAKTFILVLAAAGTLLAGCDKDDGGIQVDSTIETAFRSRHPDATRVEWERKSEYYVADFRLNGADAEAWYSAQAVWYMTETDVRYAELPQLIKSTYEAGDYAGWRIDDIDKLECLDMETVYIIEVEQGNIEYDLYYSPEGVLIKAVPDGGNSSHMPAEIPALIKDCIETEYPQARIVDIEFERGMIEVDIIDGRTPREVVFSQAGQWTYTKTKVKKADVPLTVLNTLTVSQYNSWRIDDIDHFVTTTTEYYLFELESGNQEVDLKIDIDGNILQ